MKGGVASGFNHVEQKVTQRLLHIKGRHHVRCEEVEKTWSSFNDGDVFILDLGKVQYVWMGKESSRTEKIKVRNSNMNIDLYDYPGPGSSFVNLNINELFFSWVHLRCQHGIPCIM